MAHATAFRPEIQDACARRDDRLKIFKTVAEGFQIVAFNSEEVLFLDEAFAIVTEVDLQVVYGRLVNFGERGGRDNELSFVLNAREAVERVVCGCEFHFNSSFQWWCYWLTYLTVDCSVMVSPPLIESLDRI